MKAVQGPDAASLDGVKQKLLASTKRASTSRSGMRGRMLFGETHQLGGLRNGLASIGIPCFERTSLMLACLPLSPRTLQPSLRPLDDGASVLGRLRHEAPDIV